MVPATHKPCLFIEVVSESRLHHELLETLQLDLHIGHLPLESAVALHQTLQLRVHSVKLSLLLLTVLPRGRSVLGLLPLLLLLRIGSDGRASLNLALVLLTLR